MGPMISRTGQTVGGRSVITIIVQNASWSPEIHNIHDSRMLALKPKQTSRFTGGPSEQNCRSHGRSLYRSMAEVCFNCADHHDLIRQFDDNSDRVAGNFSIPALVRGLRSQAEASKIAPSGMLTPSERMIVIDTHVAVDPEGVVAFWHW